MTLLANVLVIAQGAQGLFGSAHGAAATLTIDVVVYPPYSMQIVGSAPAGVATLGQVVFGNGRQFFVPGTAVDGGPITSVLTNPALPSGQLAVWGTVPPAIQAYGIGATNLSVNDLGNVFLVTPFGGLLTDPSSPGQNLERFGVAPGNGDLYQLSCSFGPNGELIVGGNGGILSDPPVRGGVLSILASAPNGFSSGGPTTSPQGDVYVSDTASAGPGFTVLTHPSTAGGALAIFGTSPLSVGLIVSGQPAFAFGRRRTVFTVGVVNNTGVVLTNPTVAGGGLQVFGVAPPSILLFPNPVVAKNDDLYVLGIPATAVYTNPVSLGGRMTTFGLAPAGYALILHRDHAVSPLSPLGELYIHGYDPGTGAYAIFTDPSAPGGELTPVAVFHNTTSLSYPSVNGSGAVFVAVGAADGTLTVLAFRRPHARHIPFAKR